MRPDRHSTRKVSISGAQQTQEPARDGDDEDNGDSDEVTLLTVMKMMVKLNTIKIMVDKEGQGGASQGVGPDRGRGQTGGLGGARRLLTGVFRQSCEEISVLLSDAADVYC